MKKLLPVMAVVLCACLSMGFTAPHKNTNQSTTADNFHAKIAKQRAAAVKMRNSAWVNPLVTAQLPVKFKFGSAHVIVNNKNFWYQDYLISATFSINYFPNDVSNYGLYYYWPDTNWPVEFDMKVDPTWFLYVTITERDVNAGTPAHRIYYVEHGTTANYMWYPKQAHEYIVEFEW